MGSLSTFFPYGFFLSFSVLSSEYFIKVNFLILFENISFLLYIILLHLKSSNIPSISCSTSGSISVSLKWKFKSSKVSPAGDSNNYYKISLVLLFISVYLKLRCRVFNFDDLFFKSPSINLLKPSSLTLLRPKVSLNSQSDRFDANSLPINLQHLLVISSFFQRCNPTLVNLFFWRRKYARLFTPLLVISQKAA